MKHPRTDEFNNRYGRDTPREQANKVPTSKRDDLQGCGRLIKLVLNSREV